MDEFEREEQDFFFAYNMILDLPISEHAKIVYMCLCRFSDGDKKSFPSHASIGKKCSIKSRTTVIDAIDKLMEVGLLDYKPRKTSKGGQTSNLYFLYNKPNKEVQKKYQKLKFLKEKKKSSRCSTDRHPPVQEMDSPPVQEMDSPPCSGDGHPLFNRWTAPVQQMDSPCSGDEHEVYPSKNTHFKNTQSINQDGQMDSHALQNLLETIGVSRLKHTAQISVVESALTDLLQRGRVGKKVYPREEIAATLQNLTVEKIDAALDRWEGQSKKRKIPSPYEYIKTCLFAAGKEVFVQQPDALPDLSGRTAPTYDLDEFVRMSMDRLMGDKQERRE